MSLRAVVQLKLHISSVPECSSSTTSLINDFENVKHLLIPFVEIVFQELAKTQRNMRWRVSRAKKLNLSFIWTECSDGDYDIDRNSWKPSFSRENSEGVGK